jgi:hypothetical protein
MEAVILATILAALRDLAVKAITANDQRHPTLLGEAVAELATLIANILDPAKPGETVTPPDAAPLAVTLDDTAAPDFTAIEQWNANLPAPTPAPAPVVTPTPTDPDAAQHAELAAAREASTAGAYGLPAGAVATVAPPAL